MQELLYDRIGRFAWERAGIVGWVLIDQELGRLKPTTVTSVADHSIVIALTVHSTDDSSPQGLRAAAGSQINDFHSELGFSEAASHRSDHRPLLIVGQAEHKLSIAGPFNNVSLEAVGPPDLAFDLSHKL